MSISFNASNSKPVINGSSSEENSSVSISAVFKHVGFALEVGRLAEEVIALAPSFVRSSQESIPPIVRDNNIYSNKKLISCAQLDSTATYRYVMKEVAIYGTTAKECEQVYRLYQNLGKTEQGQLVQTGFMSKYHAIKTCFLENPHSFGTNNWKIHELLKAHLFENPLTRYPSHKHASEIAAFTLELELALPGFLQKYGVGDLGEVLHDALYHQRSLSKRIFTHLPLQKSFPENTHTISLSHLNNAQNLPTGMSLFKSVGNGVKKALKVANHPLSGILLEICFSYKPGEENALLNAIQNGVAVWSLGTTMNLMMLTALGSPFTITYSITAMAAEIVPDFNEMADSLPNAMEVLDSPDCKNLSMLEKVALQECIIDAKMGLKLLGILQAGFKALNPQRIWEKLKTKSVGEPQKYAISEEISEQIENYVAQALNPYLNANNHLGSFFINPAALLSVPEWAAVSGAGGITQPDLRNCELQWKVKQRGAKGLPTIETTLEIPKDSLESLGELTAAAESAFPDVLDLEAAENANVNTSHLHLHPLVREEAMPSFGELAKITDIQVGVVSIGGGLGLTLFLASGAKVSVAVTEMGLSTGISIPLGSGFLATLGTGLVYAVPITAVLITAPFIIRAHIVNRLNEDNASAIKEIEKAQDALAMCVDFFEKFSRGEVDKEEFLAKVNQTSRLLSRSSYNMEKRGKYFENYKGSAFEYFSRKTRLEQIDLDLREMAHNILVKHNVDSTYAHGIKTKPLEQLYDELRALADKKVISAHEKFQQEALKSEICTRIQNGGDLGAIAKVETLMQKPAAVSLEPSGIVKPRKMKVKSIHQGSKVSFRRATQKTEHLMGDLASTYSQFCEEARGYKNVEVLEKAANRVKEQIECIHSEDGLINYVVMGTQDTALLYYSDFIAGIRRNVDNTLAKAKAVESGQVTEDVKPLFSMEERNILSFRTALKTFDQASACLHDESLGFEQKNRAFDEMMKAAKIIAGLSHLSGKPEELKEIIDPVLKIDSQYDSFESYISTMDRLETIKTHIEGLQVVNQGENDVEKKKSSEAVKNELETAYGHAKKLVELGVSKEDIEKLTGKPEDAGKMQEEIVGYATSICDVYTVKKYEAKMPNIYMPAARLFIHVLGDFQRFDGYENLKLPFALLSATHSFAPDLLPTGLTLPVAYWKGEGEAMRGALCEKINKVYFSSKDAICHPLATAQSATSLRKRSNLLQSANIAVQIGASVITAGTEKVFGESQAVKQINKGVHFTAFIVNSASNLVYYTHIGAKFHQYCMAGNLLVKIHKIGFGVGSFASLGFDFYEFMATDLGVSSQEKWGYSDRFKKEIKDRLPNFNGNLPESSLYYGGRDCAFTAMYGFMGANPITVGLAVYQGGASVYNYLSGKYQDDALCAIMLNYHYNSKQPQTQKIKQSLTASIKNLKYHLNGSFTVKDSDSKITKRARALYFEHEISSLEKNGALADVEGVISMTHLQFRPMSCVYRSAKIEVFDAIDIVFKRFNAFLKHCSLDARYCIEHFEQRAEELANVKEYFTQKFEAMPRNERERNKESCDLILDSIKRISFVHEIIYLEETGNVGRVLEETELAWDDVLTSCKFKVMDIEVADSLDLFFKRCKALHKKVCEDSSEAREYIFQALTEIEKVSDYLDKKAVNLNDPEYLKEGRKELRLNVATTFLSCYCVICIKDDFEGGLNSWEALQMFDKIPKAARNVLHWYTLGYIVEGIVYSCESKSDLFDMELGTNGSQLIVELTSLQRSCFTIILTMLREKEAAGQELSEFDAQLCTSSLQILAKLNRKLPSESNFAQIKADTDINFHDLLQNLLNDKA